MKRNLEKTKIGTKKPVTKPKVKTKKKTVVKTNVKKKVTEEEKVEKAEEKGKDEEKAEEKGKDEEKAEDTGVEKISNSISKVSISTRASARLHRPSPTMEKSKKLIKKAVTKSKQLKAKITPKVLRRLRPRKTAVEEKLASKEEPKPEVETKPEEMETDEQEIKNMEPDKPVMTTPIVAIKSKPRFQDSENEVGVQPQPSENKTGVEAKGSGDICVKSNIPTESEPSGSPGAPIPLNTEPVNPLNDPILTSSPLNTSTIEAEILVNKPTIQLPESTEPSLSIPEVSALKPTLLSSERISPIFENAAVTSEICPKTPEPKDSAKPTSPVPALTNPEPNLEDIPEKDGEQDTSSDSPKLPSDQESSPIKPKIKNLELEETINSYAATKNLLFDSLLSEPAKQKLSPSISSSQQQKEHVFNSSKKPEVWDEPAPSVVTPLTPIVSSIEPLTVNTNVVVAEQPMFSPDEDDFSAQGILI